MKVTLELNKELVEKAEAFATDLLTNQLDKQYRYHTLGHTRQVVELTQLIGKAEGISPDDLRLLALAAWLHDLGYVERYIGHEEASLNLARQFLTEHQAPEPIIDQVEKLIDATRLGYEPQSELEEVIKDADLYNLATEEALENSERIRQEWLIFCDKVFTDEEWDQFNLEFFEQHHYYTDYAREVLEPKKADQVQRLRRRVANAQAAAGVDSQKLEKKIKKREKKIKKLEAKLEKEKMLRPDRGIETMFRSTYRTHINLSSIADNKANILLSINAIIISITFSNAIDTYNNLSYIIYPSIAILITSLLTIIFAILATRPKINSGIFSRDDILNKRTNLLFFGNFHRMELDDYKWGIGEMMKDADYLYGSMTTDIYFLGRVLAKKFTLLRLSYNIFMYGMIISVVVFLLTFILYNNNFIS